LSHFFAYLARMKYIQRWGLMRNVRKENIQEHSLQAAMIAHNLAIVRNKLYGGDVDPQRVLLLAVYHEVSEVITGDLATPIKYFNPEIKKAYKDIEKVANERLFSMLPQEFKSDYEDVFFPVPEDEEHWKIVKAADKLCAYLKCIEELKAGNLEFAKAERSIHKDLLNLELPEVTYFMEHFLPSFHLTLDELN
jgi:5'-deoxynucleotidase